MTLLRPTSTPINPTPGLHISLLSDAIARRMVTLPPGTTTTYTDCRRCGLLLTPLPRPVPVRRPCSLKILGRTLRTFHRTFVLTHAHVARPDSTPACHDCATSPFRCHNHTSELCDLPSPLLCSTCTDPVTPGTRLCSNCPHLSHP